MFLMELQLNHQVLHKVLKIFQQQQMIQIKHYIKMNVQSLFKQKSNCGTSTHFKDQIGVADDRTKGFNLSDVVSVNIWIK